VNQGHVFARRTEGRHLRFHRVEVVRFLRRFGYPVPPLLGRAPPRVLIAAGPSARIELRGCDHIASEGLIATVLEAAAGLYEVFVLELDRHDAALTRELVHALRARPATRTLSVVGLSERARRQKQFVEEGGDVALAPGRVADLVQTARWLTGGAAEPPARAVTASSCPRG
jgi:hypothetical protein